MEKNAVTTELVKSRNWRGDAMHGKRRTPDLVLAWQYLLMCLQLFLWKLWKYVQRQFTFPEFYFKTDEEKELQKWLAKHIGNVPNDFSHSWRDGLLLCLLLDKVKPGCCSIIKKLKNKYPIKNVAEAFHILDTHFNMDVPLKVNDIVSCTNGSDLKLYNLLRQLKQRTEIQNECKEPPTPTDPVDASEPPFPCRAEGFGLTSALLNKKADFVISFAFPSDLDVIISIQGPSGNKCCERITDLSPKYKKTQAACSPFEVQDENGIALFYEIRYNRVNCTYIPRERGQHTISVLYRGRHVTDSPFLVTADTNLKPENPPNYNQQEQTHEQSSESVHLPKNEPARRNDNRQVGRVVSSRILRYIVRIGGNDVVVQADDIGDLATELLKLDYQIRKSPLSRRNSWGFAGDNERKVSQIRQFCIDVDDLEAQAFRGRSHSLTTSDEVKVPVVKNGYFEYEDIPRRSRLETVIEGSSTHGKEEESALLNDGFLDSLKTPAKNGTLMGEHSKSDDCSKIEKECLQLSEGCQSCNMPDEENLLNPTQEDKTSPGNNSVCENMPAQEELCHNACSKVDEKLNTIEATICEASTQTEDLFTNNSTSHSLESNTKHDIKPLITETVSEKSFERSQVCERAYMTPSQGNELDFFEYSTRTDKVALYLASCERGRVRKLVSSYCAHSQKVLENSKPSRNPSKKPKASHSEITGHDMRNDNNQSLEISSQNPEIEQKTPRKRRSNIPVLKRTKGVFKDIDNSINICSQNGFSDLPECINSANSIETNNITKYAHEGCNTPSDTVSSNNEYLNTTCCPENKTSPLMSLGQANFKFFNTPFEKAKDSPIHMKIKQWENYSNDRQSVFSSATNFSLCCNVKSKLNFWENFYKSKELLYTKDRLLKKRLGSRLVDPAIERDQATKESTSNAALSALSSNLETDSRDNRNTPKHKTCNEDKLLSSPCRQRRSSDPVLYSRRSPLTSYDEEDLLEERDDENGNGRVSMKKLDDEEEHFKEDHKPDEDDAAFAEDEYIDDEISESSAYWGDMSQVRDLKKWSDASSDDLRLLTELGYFEDKLEGGKAECCKVFGIAAYFGYVSMKNSFRVLTRGSCNGNLSATVQGIGHHDVSFVSVRYLRQDLYEVVYQVMTPGLYLISVRWTDSPILGSPFLCKVTY